jgi:hypothetical protein
MNTLLLYFVFALPGGQWQGSAEVYQTTDVKRCEAVAAQLNAAAVGKTYTCETLVTTGAQNFGTR